MSTILQARSICKTYATKNGENIRAVDGIDLTVAANDFFCIVGPSGCGKSTFLRIAAGLEPAGSGDIRFRGRKIPKPHPQIGMVFQEYSLFPWLSVLDNVAAGPAFAGVKKKERYRTAGRYLDVVGMSEFAGAFPHELSGGMRQRVAIARAFANDPEVLLMEEPFGSLDAHTRILLQKELLRIWENHRKTILFVTHSVDEAVYLGDRVVIMSARPGRIRETLEIDMPRPRSRANPEISRSLGALDEARSQGRLIAGVYCIFAPSEMIRAAGMIPVGLCGKKAEPIAKAEEILPANLCPLIKSSYGFAAGDTCPFFSIADCIVGETTCDGKTKMYEYLGRLKPLRLMRLPDAPEDPYALAYWLAELRRFKTFLEERSGHKITDDALRREIAAQNRVRGLLKRLVYVNRKTPPALTGTMLLPVLESKSFFVDTDAYQALLEDLVTALENGARADSDRSGKPPRILLTGTPIGKGCEKVLTLLEKAGARVVVLENCTGLKGFMRQVDENDSDPLAALARHYLALPCACMSPNRGRFESVDELIRAFGIEGVVDLTWQACHTYNVESADLKNHIEETHGLSVLHLETDYGEADTGQLKVRIEAFLEMVRDMSY